MELFEEVLNLLHSEFSERDQVQISINLSRGVILGAESRNVNCLKVHVRLVAHEDLGFVASEQAG